MRRVRAKKAYDASGEPSSVLYFIIINLMRFLTVVILGARVKRNQELKQLQGPIIVLGNHPSFMDPVFMAISCWPRRVHFLTASSFFRQPLVRSLLKALKTIPKVQFRSDAQALKHMLRIIKKDGIIGIYPEGQRSLDGSLQPIDDAIGKFVKKTGCSVVVVSSRGAYLSWPRWADSWLRICRIEVTSRILFKSEQIMMLDAAALQQQIHQALDYNEYEWQQQNRHALYSIVPASGLHKLCHKCPSCCSDLSMRSRRIEMVCGRCGFVLRMDRYGFLHSIKNKTGWIGNFRLPTSPYAWHQWQIVELKKQWSVRPFAIKQPAQIQLVNPADGSGRILGRGQICLDSQGLYFNSDTDQEPGQLKIPIVNRTGISADFGSQFEIILADKVYRILPDNGQAVILLADAIRVVQHLNTEAASGYA